MLVTTIQYLEVNIYTSTVMCEELLIVAENLYVARWECLTVALFNIQVPMSRARRRESSTHKLLSQSSVSQAHSAKMRGADITHTHNCALQCLGISLGLVLIPRVNWNMNTEVNSYLQEFRFS